MAILASVKAILRCTAIFSLAIIPMGCATDEPMVTWNPVDYEDVIDRAENPTGSLPMGDLDAIQSEIETTFQIDSAEMDTIFEFLNGLQESFQVLIDAMNESDRGGASANADGPVSTGTSIQVRASCIGPDPANPNTSFEYGQIRIVGVTASLDEIAKNGLPLNGHMLVSFEECVMENIVSNGESPAFFDDVNNVVAIQFDMEVSIDDEFLHFNYSVVFMDGEYVLLMDSPGTGSYSFTVQSSETRRFVLRAANGALGCESKDTAWICSILE